MVLIDKLSWPWALLMLRYFRIFKISTLAYSMLFNLLFMEKIALLYWTIILNWLFDERKTFTVRLPYSSPKKRFSKSFIKKIEDFTNNPVKLIKSGTYVKCSSYVIRKARYRIKFLWCIMYIYLISRFIFGHITVYSLRCKLYWQNH